MSDTEISPLIGSQHSLEKFFAFLLLHCVFQVCHDGVISAIHIFFFSFFGGGSFSPVLVPCPLHLPPE